MPKLLLDIEEAAEVLSISTRSVRNLVKRGLLTPNRSLRKLLFTPEDLEKFAKH